MDPPTLKTCKEKGSDASKKDNNAVRTAPALSKHSNTVSVFPIIK